MEEGKFGRFKGDYGEAAKMAVMALIGFGLIVCGIVAKTHHVEPDLCFIGAVIAFYKIFQKW